MIKYNLNCKCKKNFESWFSNSKEYERLEKNRLLVCPFCNSNQIRKSIMSPNLSSKTNKNYKTTVFEKKIRKKLKDLRSYVEKNCKYVGENFTQEARSIHYDKKSSKPIYGIASKEQTSELKEEGIEVATIPWIDKIDN
tara:strand:- start:142 stop:558 length:417 start_codon:yes stop_codon:yes gene_type:complete